MIRSFSRSLGVFSALVFAGAASSRAAGKPVVSSPAPFVWRTENSRAFGVGESLLYVIKYGFISGGNATLEVRSTETVHGRPAYHIVSEARTNKTLDVVFKVRDLNESWMDVQSLCTHRYRQIMREGRYSRQVESRYEHPKGTFVYWNRNRKGQESTTEGAMPAYVQDVLSSLYLLRTRPLVVGQDITVDVNSGAKTWSLLVHVKGMEKVNVPAGTFRCFRVQPLIAGEGLFMQTGNLEVWLTDDGRRLPVLMRSKVMVGAFTAELVEAQFDRTSPRVLGD